MPLKETLKEPLLKANRLIGHSSAKNHMSKPHIGHTDALHDDRHQRALEKAQEKDHKEREQAQETQDFVEDREEQERQDRIDDSPELRARYGNAPALGDGETVAEESSLESMSNGILGANAEVAFKARLHHVRQISPKMVFVLLRQQIHTIQGVIQVREGIVSENFVRWTKHLATEVIVRVGGMLQKPYKDIRSCTIHNLEVLVDSMHVLVNVKERLPIDVYNISRVAVDDDIVPEGENQQPVLLASNRVRAANRVSFLRTPAAQGIFRIFSGIGSAARRTLEESDFIEIHTPKLQPGATESGSEVFKVNFFGRTAFLAQSPQLAKQLAISADFGRVYEIGPVFRAENSNTHRHLTEYVSLDLEMVIERHYHEVMGVVDALLKNIFESIYKRHRKEVDIVKQYFPHEDLVWLEETPRLTYREGIELLNSSGWKDEHGHQASDTEDLSTKAEKRLGELVKEKYKTDYYILDKFPASARPFYTQLDEEDAKFTNSFDIFVRGQEITTGGQRINDPGLLVERMEKTGINPRDMEEYMQGFEWGILPHGGCGIGMERILFLLLNLGDIRNASLYPRDPKSLPEKPPAVSQLAHPEADTMRYQHAYEHKLPTGPPPPIEQLIANYGDATNTSWLDDRYTIYRHEQTGAAVGYAEENGYAIVMGDPLCDPRQHEFVIKAFLLDMRRKEDLRPLWILVSKQVEDILASKLAWRTMSCIAEDRVIAAEATNVAQKVRQAEDAGVQVREIGLGEPIPEDVREACERRIEDWKQSREGKPQVHMTEVRPWIDAAHRRYLYAVDKEGEIVALVILHQLSREHGFQVKFALDFPGSPGGTIELLIGKSLAALANSGVKSVTFGAGATAELVAGQNLCGMRARLLEKAYGAITKQLNLVAKSEFRAKFGAEEDALYICYPRLGMGVSGARTLIRFFEDEI